MANQEGAAEWKIYLPRPSTRVDAAGVAWLSRTSQQPGVGMTLLPGVPIPTGSYRALALPHWLLLVLIAVVPSTQVLPLLRRRRRLKRGLCPGCGYDLRASHERCPKCGTAAAAG